VTVRLLPERLPGRGKGRRPIMGPPSEEVTAVFWRKALALAAAFLAVWLVHATLLALPDPAPLMKD
jgi:hypothetical protein